MPDYSYLAKPQTGGGLETLSNVLGMARGATALQRERGTLSADIERAKAESSRAVTEADVSKRTAQPRIEQQEAHTATAKTGAAAAQWRLDADQATKGYEIAAGIAQDPAVVKGDSRGSMEALMRAEEQMRNLKIPEGTIRAQMAPLYMTAAHKPEGLRQMLDNIVRSGSGVQTQAGVINTPVSPVQTPSGAIAPLQLQPGAQGGVQPVPISATQQPANAPPQPGIIPPGIPPSGVERQSVDALGRPVIERKDQAGAISYAPPPGSQYKPLMTLPPGETPATATPLLALRDKAQEVAAHAPEQRFNNRQILELTDDAFTGTGSPKLASLLNSVGLSQFVPKKPEDMAAATSQLQHFIGLQIQQNAAAQGANTDAARQLAAQAVLPVNTPAQAIKAITKINDAYVKGAEEFNKGMQAAINSPSNTKDIFAIRDFQNAWSANMDPRISLLQNAWESGDKKEIEKIKKELGPEGIKQLMTKARNLHNLSTRGSL